MTSLTITIILTFPFGLHAQDKIAGTYRDYFGSHIQMNADHTFKYTWHFDMSGSWTKGTWTSGDDTVYLHMLPTFDTLSYTTDSGLAVDSLILSTDEIGDRFKLKEYAGMGLSSGGQNLYPYPEKLFYKKGRLYGIKDGKLYKKKQKEFWTHEKFPPWFFKSND